MDVLIVDDQKSIRLATAIAVESEGHYVESVENGTIALSRIKEGNFDLVLLDLRLGNENGMDVLAQIVELKQQPLVVIFTAHASIPTAVKATQIGAFDYLEKPFTPDQLRAILVKAKKTRQAQTEVVLVKETARDFKPEVQQVSPPISFVMRDDVTKKALDTMFRAAATNASMLILGESGTGKSVIAHEVHARSHLRDKPFVTVSCPSLSKELLESSLFGHIKGSFTGAVRDTWGKIHTAEGGTLFLDEIGELPMEIQPKLLRLLQEREYERIGENKLRQATVRIIAATNRDLAAEVLAGSFREDLFYRLNVINVTLPPLRDRPGDLLFFAKEFLEFFSRQLGGRIDGFSEGGRAALLRHAWPGNLRELRNAIERATILATGDKLEAGDLPYPSSRPAGGTTSTVDSPEIGGEHSLEDIGQAHMNKVLNWAPSLHNAAEVLGIDKATLYRKRKRNSTD